MVSRCLLAAGPANQEIAIGSAFFAKVSGADTAPVLTIKNQAGQSEQVFESAGDDSYQLTSIVANSGSYEISLDGDRHSSWTLSVIADQKPTIGFRRPPSVSERRSERRDGPVVHALSLARRFVAAQAILKQVKPAMVAVTASVHPALTHHARLRTHCDLHGGAHRDAMPGMVVRSRSACRTISQTLQRCASPTT